MQQVNASYLLAAFAVQYVGLILERWFFFARPIIRKTSTTKLFKSNTLSLAKPGTAHLTPFRYTL
jgi:hypothetical protein